MQQYSYLYKLPFCIKYKDLNILENEYILTARDRKGFGFKENNPDFERAKYVQGLFEQNISDFILLKQIGLPDKSELLIYKKKDEII